MKVYDAATIRNVALVGHAGSGKTQLASAILFNAGMVNRFGKVDEGTTITDFDEEEVARKHTLSASLCYVEWNKHKVNVVDTPGIGNFFSDARAALQVSEAALVVVRSEEHTSELQSRFDLVCRLLLEKKKKKKKTLNKIKTYKNKLYTSKKALITIHLYDVM